MSREHTPLTAVRFVLTAWRLQLKLMSSMGMYLFVSILMPIMLAITAYYMFHGSTVRSTTMVVLGGGFIGMWSTTLFGSGAAITRLRWAGTLESLVAAPTPLAMSLAPLTVATSTMGIYSIAATLGWAALFKLPIDIADPLAFVISVLVTVVSVGLLGMLLSVAFVMYPAAQALSNLVQYPIWLLSGALVPLSALPEWARICAIPLAPTWGVRAVYASVEGRGTVWPLLVSLLLAACYLAVTLVMLRFVERRAREKATLALS